MMNDIAIHVTGHYVLAQQDNII